MCKKSNEMKLNFSLIGTPAESTVGTMMRKLRKNMVLFLMLQNMST